MEKAVMRRRLEVQGFLLDDVALRQIGRWLRFTPALCATGIAIGTLLASPSMLWALAATAAAGALFPRHPFDFLYNFAIRFLTRTQPLPVNRAPRRFACGVAALWLAGTAMAFEGGQPALGYILGGAIVVLATLVSLTDICIPSVVYQFLFARRDRKVVRV